MENNEKIEVKISFVKLEELYWCPFCGYKTPSRNDFELHLYKYHDAEKIEKLS